MEIKNDTLIYKERKRWLFLGLPFTFTVYFIKEDVITTDAGFFKSTENDCYMYKVQDVSLSRTLMQKIFGLGTVTCYTGDTTNPQLALKNIRKAREIKDYILKQSEAARIKRRTLNMVDIGANGDIDGDGIPDIDN